MNCRLIKNASESDAIETRGMIARVLCQYNFDPEGGGPGSLGLTFDSRLGLTCEPEPLSAIKSSEAFWSYRAAFKKLWILVYECVGVEPRNPSRRAAY